MPSVQRLFHHGTRDLGPIIFIKLLLRVAALWRIVVFSLGSHPHFTFKENPSRC